MTNKTDPILRFHGQYEFLNNFYPAKLLFDGILYYNSEAAYQAHKSEKHEDRKQFATMEPDAAKKLGNKLPIRPDWEDVKLELMEKIVWEKFTQHPELAQKLLATGDAYLAEGNYWHDLYWGIDDVTGEGANHLGQLLMALREKFRQEGIPENTAAVSDTVLHFGNIALTDGDITGLNTDCIVCAATSPDLRPGAGLDGAIHREAGPELLEACLSLDGCQTGEAKLTRGFKLKSPFVIHTIGPVYRTENAEELLKRCYCSCLNLALESDLHSISFPIISTGKFRFPKKLAAQIAVSSVREWLIHHPDSDMQIFFSCVVHELFELMQGYLTTETQA